MQIDVSFDAQDANGRAFLSWQPAKLTVRLLPSADANTTALVENKGSVLVGFALNRTDAPIQALAIDLPTDGSPVEIWVVPEFENSGTFYGDTNITISDFVQNTSLWSQNAMVRVRKNANTLTDAERDKFINAFAALNDSGQGRFRDFRNMHLDKTNSQAHGDAGFLPWHRAYLLDLERELQNIDPEVSLHYWRFDQPAPYLFTRDFIGVASSFTNGMAEFSVTHPFQSWITDGQVGIQRFRSSFPPTVLDEISTLALGGAMPNATYSGFLRMEGNPHGWAHGQFGGFISRIHTAAKDPLFFMLHCNVDRLWAKWAVLHDRSDLSDPRSFRPSGRVGHRLDDTMWPWNGEANRVFPPSAPGGGLANSDITALPGPVPLVRDMVDYQSLHGSNYLGFDYDDVPVELNAGTGGMV